MRPWRTSAQAETSTKLAARTRCPQAKPSAQPQAAGDRRRGEEPQQGRRARDAPGAQQQRGKQSAAQASRRGAQGIDAGGRREHLADARPKPGAEVEIDAGEGEPGGGGPIERAVGGVAVVAPAEPVGLADRQVREIRRGKPSQASCAAVAERRFGLPDEDGGEDSPEGESRLVREDRRRVQTRCGNQYRLGAAAQPGEPGVQGNEQQRQDRRVGGRGPEQSLPQARKRGEQQQGRPGGSEVASESPHELEDQHSV